jgi:hypothetical protein
MQNIFKNLLKKIDKSVPTASVDVTMLETSESVSTANESIEVQGMSDDEKLDCDKKEVDALSSKLIIVDGVLNFIVPTFSKAWHIETAKDYPLITMKKIDKDNLTKIEKEYLAESDYSYTTNVVGGWVAAFYTIEGVTLYMEKYYEIRSGHLETLFPKL